jgi:hypothetical protein
VVLVEVLLAEGLLAGAAVGDFESDVDVAGAAVESLEPAAGLESDEAASPEDELPFDE